MSFSSSSYKSTPTRSYGSQNVHNTSSSSETQRPFASREGEYSSFLYNQQSPSIPTRTSLDVSREPNKLQGIYNSTLSPNRYLDRNTSATTTSRTSMDIMSTRTPNTPPQNASSAPAAARSPPSSNTTSATNTSSTRSPNSQRTPGVSSKSPRQSSKSLNTSASSSGSHTTSPIHSRGVGAGASSNKHPVNSPINTGRTSPVNFSSPNRSFGYNYGSAPSNAAAAPSTSASLGTTAASHYNTAAPTGSSLYSHFGTSAPQATSLTSQYGSAPSYAGYANGAQSQHSAQPPFKSQSSQPNYNNNSNTGYGANQGGYMNGGGGSYGQPAAPKAKDLSKEELMSLFYKAVQDENYWCTSQELDQWRPYCEYFTKELFRDINTCDQTFYMLTPKERFQRLYNQKSSEWREQNYLQRTGLRFLGYILDEFQRGP